jgi:hypothetical protein
MSYVVFTIYIVNRKENQMTTYLLAIEKNDERAEVRLNAYFPTQTESLAKCADEMLDGTFSPFASLSLDNDDVDFLFEEDDDLEQVMWSGDFYTHFEGAYITERVEEFLGSLDHYAKKATGEVKTWACRTCGATTTDPTHMFITYFHDGCKG